MLYLQTHISLILSLIGTLLLFIVNKYGLVQPFGAPPKVKDGTYTYIHYVGWGCNFLGYLLLLSK